MGGDPDDGGDGGTEGACGATMEDDRSGVAPIGVRPRGEEGSGDVSAYREVGARGDGRPPEIEVFRWVSASRRILFVAAATFLLGSLVGAGLALVRRDASLASLCACGVLCAVALAVLGMRRFSVLVVSHVPAERTFVVKLDAKDETAQRHTFDGAPAVRLEEVAGGGRADGPDVPAAFRVRIEGAPKGVTLEQPLPEDVARKLRRALTDAIAAWPSP